MRIIIAVEGADAVLRPATDVPAATEVLAALNGGEPPDALYQALGVRPPATRPTYVPTAFIPSLAPGAGGAISAGPPPPELLQALGAVAQAGAPTGAPAADGGPAPA